MSFKVIGEGHKFSVSCLCVPSRFLNSRIKNRIKMFKSGAEILSNTSNWRDHFKVKQCQTIESQGQEISTNWRDYEITDRAARYVGHN